MPKQDPGTEITGLEYYTALFHWIKFWGTQELGGHNRHFANFLGMQNGLTINEYDPRTDNFWVRQSAARKIRLLNGPHHHALLTAYKLRKASRKK